MEKDYIIATFSIAGTLAGVIVGTGLSFLLTLWRDSVKEKSHREKRFRKIKSSIFLVATTNEIPRKLHDLREFYIENEWTLKGNTAFAKFYEEWLDDPIVERGESSAGGYTDKNIVLMYADLKEIEV